MNFPIPSAYPLANSWLGLALLFICFLIFLSSILGTGAFLVSRFHLIEEKNPVSNAAICTALGVIAFILLAGFLGNLGLLGEKYRLVFLLAVCLGSISFIAHKRQFWALRKIPILWIILFGVAIGVRTIAAAYPLEHGDPLVYHLLAPRLWMQQGRIAFNPNLPMAMLASSWSYLYLWNMEIFTSLIANYGLVEAQIVSQWSHLYLGWLASALLVYAILQDLPFSRREIILASFTTLFVSSVQWTGVLAKNDCGISMLSLSCLLFLRNYLEQKRKIWMVFCGISFGLAFIGKMAALFSIGPMLAIELLSQRKKIGNYLSFLGSSFILLLAFLSALAIIAWPNYRDTGNPFYPMLERVFPSGLVSQTLQNILNTITPKFAWSNLSLIWQRYPELAKQNIGILFFPILIPCLLFQRTRAQALKVLPYTAMGVVAYILFIASQGATNEMRFLEASAMLLAASGILSSFVFFKLFAQNSRFLYSILIVLVLASSKIPLYVLGRMGKTPLGENYILRHTAGDAKAWLRINAHAKDLIVDMWDNELYYLAPKNITILTERLDLDKATYGVRDFPSFLHGICKSSQAKYLLDAHPNSTGLKKQFGISPANWVYRGADAIVYDLEKLEKEYAGTEGHFYCGGL